MVPSTVLLGLAWPAPSTLPCLCTSSTALSVLKAFLDESDDSQSPGLVDKFSSCGLEASAAWPGSTWRSYDYCVYSPALTKVMFLLSSCRLLLLWRWYQQQASSPDCVGNGNKPCPKDRVYLGWAGLHNELAPWTLFTRVLHVRSETRSHSLPLTLQPCRCSLLQYAHYPTGLNHLNHCPHLSQHWLSFV